MVISVSKKFFTQWCSNWHPWFIYKYMYFCWHWYLCWTLYWTNSDISQSYSYFPSIWLSLNNWTVINNFEDFNHKCGHLYFASFWTFLFISFLIYLTCRPAHLVVVADLVIGYLGPNSQVTVKQNLVSQSWLSSRLFGFEVLNKRVPIFCRLVLTAYCWRLFGCEIISKVTGLNNQR